LLAEAKQANAALSFAVVQATRREVTHALLDAAVLTRNKDDVSLLFGEFELGLPVAASSEFAWGRRLAATGEIRARQGLARGFRGACAAANS
jgi:hypothetical protein